MELIYIILGALLAVGGSFLAQRNQQIISQKQTDESLLLEINSVLLDYHASSEHLKQVPKESAMAYIHEQRFKLEYELSQLLERLSRLAIQLKSKQYKNLSIKLTKFSLDAPLRAPENLHNLTRDVQLSINSEMIRQYEQEISDDPSKF